MPVTGLATGLESLKTTTKFPLHMAKKTARVDAPECAEAYKLAAERLDAAEAVLNAATTPSDISDAVKARYAAARDVIAAAADAPLSSAAHLEAVAKKRKEEEKEKNDSFENSGSLRWAALRLSQPPLEHGGDIVDRDDALLLQVIKHGATTKLRGCNLERKKYQQMVKEFAATVLKIWNTRG